MSGLPEDGSIIYVRLWSRTGVESWLYNDYTFKAANAKPVAAVLTNPQPGSTLSSSTVKFEWSAGNGALQYWLDISNISGKSDIYWKDQGTARSVIVSGLPTDGRLLYIRLWTRLGPKTTDWISKDYVYTAFNATPIAAVLTSPAPGSTLSSTSVKFEWSAGFNVEEFWLTISSSADLNVNPDIYSQSQGFSRSQTVQNLPTDGRTVYVRLYWKIEGAWLYSEYIYKAVEPKVLLFLHGMNTSASKTWANVRGPLNLGTMPVISNGKESATATQDTRGKGIYAYAVAFGAFDTTSGRKGMEPDVVAGDNYSTGGDFETFEQLASEVDSAIACVRNLHRDARVVLVAHSRGGLAGRYFRLFSRIRG